MKSINKANNKDNTKTTPKRPGHGNVNVKLIFV